MSLLVSVILPVHNRERFVAVAVQSILDQTYPYFELIIIDDASTDSTLNIIEKFEDKRIKFLRNEKNLGVSASRNKGVKEANGDFIAFMDSDDISVPDRLQKQLKLFTEKPEIDICGSWVQFLNSDKIIRHKEEHEEIFTQLLLNCSVSIGVVMFKRKRIKDVLLNEQLKFGEDYELWSKVGWKTKMYNIQEPLLLYRSHEGQISGINKKQQLVLDAEIRLSLFKKIGYCQRTFPDELIKKVMLYQGFFDLYEFEIFLNWLTNLERINRKEKIFPHPQLKNVLKNLKQNLLFRIFFSDTGFGINKSWRTRALLKLDKGDLIKIIKEKFRQYIKIYT